MYRYLTYVLLIGLMTGLMACGDSTGPDGPDASEAPAIPSLENAQPDVSYFQTTDQGKTVAASSNAFTSAQLIVFGFSTLSNMSQVYQPFFQEVQGVEPDFSDGVWEWSYTASYQGSEATMRLTAEEGTNGIFWDMFLTVDSQNISFEDYNLISGFTNNEGSGGNWDLNTIFNETGSEQLLLQSVWEVISDSESTIDMTIYNEQGEADATINYSKNGPVHEMVINSATVIYWDTENEIGYLINDGGEKTCWEGRGATASDVDCATIGL
jgi:hypothetical protein